MKINLGCGSNFIHGWQNHDIDVDLTKKLPYSDSTIDKIFAEHVIEHLTSEEMLNFFFECNRVLKSGGKLRLVFPDIIRAFKKATPDYLLFASTFTKQTSNMSGWLSLAKCHGHKQMLTGVLVENSLLSVCFTDVVYAPLYYFDDELVDGHHKVIGEAYHEIESIAIEATK